MFEYLMSWFWDPVVSTSEQKISSDLLRQSNSIVVVGSNDVIMEKVIRDIRVEKMPIKVLEIKSDKAFNKKMLAASFPDQEKQLLILRNFIALDTTDDYLLNKFHPHIVVLHTFGNLKHHCKSIDIDLLIVTDLKQLNEEYFLFEILNMIGFTITLPQMRKATERNITECTCIVFDFKQKNIFWFKHS
jgi:hypothetical protein